MRVQPVENELRWFCPDCEYSELRGDELQYFEGDMADEDKIALYFHCRECSKDPVYLADPCGNQNLEVGLSMDKKRLIVKCRHHGLLVGSFLLAHPKVDLECEGCAKGTCNTVH
jgi:hypothetical protein